MKQIVAKGKKKLSVSNQIFYILNTIFWILIMFVSQVLICV